MAERVATGRGAGVALWILCAIACVFAVHALRSILVPFAVAVLLMIVVEGVAQAQRRTLPRWPEWTGRALGVLLVAAFFLGSLPVAAAQAASVAEQVVRIVARIDALLAMLGSRVGGAPMTVAGLLDDGTVRAAVGAVLDSTQSFVSVSLLVAIYLGFLLASRAAVAGRFALVLADPSRRAVAMDVVAAVRRGTGEYLWVQTVTGLLIAAVSWAIMTALGQDGASLLALVIFLTSYIPVIGPFLGVSVPAVFALGQFDGWREVVLLLAGLQGINFLVNNLLVPRMQSRRLNLDPTVVLLSLALWSYLWGIAGALLSTPLAVLAMASASAVPSLRWFAVLMSADGRPLGVRG